MNAAAIWAVPVIVAAFLLAGLLRGVDVLSAFAEGAKRGLRTAVSMLPSLILFMTVIGMFRASGALDVLSWALRPIAGPLGIPTDVVPLALLRPVSGSASLTIFQQILDRCGPDSFSGRVASVIQSASETTFYTVTVYFAAVKVSRSRHTLPCSLAGDLTVILASALFVRLFLEN